MFFHREKLLFSVAGSDGFEKRMKIYKFLLESMEDEHRINLTGKLCTDILGVHRYFRCAQIF